MAAKPVIECRAGFLTKNVHSIDKPVMIKITWYKGTENAGYNYIYDITGDPDGWCGSGEFISGKKRLNDGRGQEII